MILGVVFRIQRTLDRDKFGVLAKTSIGAQTESLCRPLDSRISAVFTTQRPPLVLFRITNLVSFYLSVLNQFLADDAPLLLSLKALYLTSSDHFNDALHGLSASISRLVEIPGVDLLPPRLIRENLDLLVGSCCFACFPLIVVRKKWLGCTSPLCPWA